jgi:ferric-dicitrate binding protein FerR (iron transport regulator)
MSENDQKVWEVISSVLNGNPSEDDKEIFDSWIKENDDNGTFYETILRTRHIPAEFTAEAKKRVYSKIETSIQPTKVNRKINLWPYAAVASVAILLTLAFHHILNREPENKVSYILAQTPNGVKSRITLPDASIVYLNSGSTLRYPATFERNERKVLLKGEAYFEVKKDPAHPFVVETGNLHVKVLGTHFNVKNYDEDNVIETSLLEGSVEVEKISDNIVNENVYLTLNQQAVYNKESGKISKRNIDASLAAIWKENKYYFENEYFSSIAAKLERNFNVKIMINSEKLNDRTFSGLLDKNRTIYQILDALKIYCNFNYVVKGDTVIIKN